jgi:hypothetical protein
MSRQFIDVQSQFRFEISGFVFVNHMFFSKLIQHRSDLREELTGSELIFHGAEGSDGGTSAFGVIAVMQALGLGLSNSFDRGFVICHVVVKLIVMLELNR